MPLLVLSLLHSARHTLFTNHFLLIFYDLEMGQEKVTADASLLHVPNLSVFLQCCDSCLQILKYSDPNHPFMHLILTMRKKFKTVTVLAHNGGRFDNQFVLNCILSQTDITVDLIMQGTKLISMSVGNVKFLDYLNYFPMALCALPKAFGFSELKKGHFPHLFNTIQSQSYVGSTADIKYFSSGNFKSQTFKVCYSATRVSENYVSISRKKL